VKGQEKAFLGMTMALSLSEIAMIISTDLDNKELLLLS